MNASNNDIKIENFRFRKLKHQAKTISLREFLMDQSTNTYPGRNIYKGSKKKTVKFNLLTLQFQTSMEEKKHRDTQHSLLYLSFFCSA